MRSVDEHLDHILETITPVESVEVPLDDALGRVLRKSVTSTIDLPPWPNSAMDGYAVRREDLASATAQQPLILPVVGDIPAGTTTPTELQPHTTQRIMTGAPIPSGCDAIVPLEKTVEWNESEPTPDAPLPETISFREVPPHSAHIRMQGEDISVGATVLDSGMHLTANRIAALAAVGCTQVCVEQQIRVAVISTGTELVEIGQPLTFGQIYDSNSPLLAALVREHGGIISMQHRVADDADALRECIRNAQQNSDVIILTGGASVGAHDTTRLVLDLELRDVDAHSDLRTVEFTKVAMQPGKPQGFGQLADGTYVWALPGNPVSVWVSFYMFVEPALKKLAGRSQWLPQWNPVRASTSWRSPEGREQIMPVIITSESGQDITVAPATTKGSGSHLAATLAHATGMVRVAAEVTEVRENDVVFMRGMQA